MSNLPQVDLVRTVKTPRLPGGGGGGGRDDDARDELPDPDYLPFPRWLEETAEALDRVDSAEWQFLGREIARLASLCRFTGAETVFQMMDRIDVLEAPGPRAAGPRGMSTGLDRLTGGLEYRYEGEALRLASGAIRVLLD